MIVHHDLHATSTDKPPMDSVALFQCLQLYVPSTTLHQLSRIALALLVMTGRVTMLGISRWAGPGGSYRTVQRFFSGCGSFKTTPPSYLISRRWVPLSWRLGFGPCMGTAPSA